MADAASLLANGRHNGAIYLAGYAIECHLKFAYGQRREEVYLPEHLEVHDWDKIINAAGLLLDIRQESNMDALYSTWSRWSRCQKQVSVLTIDTFREFVSIVRTVTFMTSSRFRMCVIDSKIGDLKVVRVITPAWKTLPNSDRIFKILQVTNKKLTDAEQKHILRFSVLTPVTN